MRLAIAINPCVPKVPFRTTFAPISRGQPLGPTRTIVTNSQTTSPEFRTSAFRSVAPTNYNTSEKSNPHHTHPASGLSTKPIATASRPSMSTPSVAVPAVMLTPPASSSEAARLDSVQSSGGPPTLAGGKRRLGMGRSGAGYSNKKFKNPGL
jgi:DNA helicase-2/ATP-dependent DNA helicase PcrA